MFSYDHADRPLEVDHYINNNKVDLVTNTYNDLGELRQKNLCSDAAQSVDYRYNIRGWLTKINNGTSFDDTNDRFGMELRYDNAATPQYNGNIGQIKWKNSDHVLREYQYTYDKLNRLTAGLYGGVANGKYTVSTLKYDANGNLERLDRKGEVGTNNDMDLLSYTYPGNRLLRVTDSGNKTNTAGIGFIDGNPTGDDYIYDRNGNLIADKNKGITSITYNYLNLPQTVTLAVNKTITYIYDAAGIRADQRSC